MDDFAIDEYLASERERESERINNYIAIGWHHVDMPSDLCDIDSWVQENIKGDWRAFAHSWVFEKEDDATLFKLRWM